MMRNTFLTHREMGECEAYYRLFPSLHLVGNSVGSVYVPTGFSKYRFLTKLSDEEAKTTQSELIEIQDRDGYYFEATSIYDKYLRRPDVIKYMSMMQFAKRYVSERFKVNKKSEDQSSESEVDYSSISSSNFDFFAKHMPISVSGSRYQSLSSVFIRLARAMVLIII